MEKSELFDLIESYLDDTLSEEKRREVEERLAQDENFSREVTLHRQLQENFKDPDRWKLRATLSEIIKEPLLIVEPSNQTKKILSNNMWKWIIILSAIFTAIGIWYLLTPATGTSIEEPIELQPSTDPSVPMASIPADTATLDVPEEKRSPNMQSDNLLASADPENFETNPSMEALVNSSSRSDGDFALNLTVPINNAPFASDKKGETVIRFAGQLSGNTHDPSSELTLNVFNNKDVNSVLVSKSLEVKLESDVLAFDVRQRMKLPFGLYYFTIQQDGDILYAGKFTIGTLIK